VDCSSDSHFEILTQAEVVGFVLLDQLSEVQVALVAIRTAASAGDDIVFIWSDGFLIGLQEKILYFVAVANDPS